MLFIFHDTCGQSVRERGTKCPTNMSITPSVILINYKILIKNKDGEHYYLRGVSALMN